MTGTLYGIGVGPGAPDLITMRAVNTLRTIDVVFAAASTKNDYSTALSIANEHMREDVEVIQLGFPMTRDKALLQAAWEQNAKTVAKVLEAGKNGAFLTLGDPLIYSTFGYLMRTLSKTNPDISVEVIPGITSYQASAARTNTILCESGENLLLVSGVQNAAELPELLAGADNSVILKTYKNFDEIRSALEKAGKENDAVFISRLGMEGEIIARTLSEAPEKPHYFSHLLVPKGKRS